MSVLEIILRAETICKRYDKYDVDKLRDETSHADDSFARLFSFYDTEIDKALRKSEMAAVETNRASMVAMNAEIRRTKAKLLEEVPKLHKLAQKKVKGLTKEELEARNDLVLTLPERIQAIPDESTTVKGELDSSASDKNINVDSTDDHIDNNAFFQHHEEATQFQLEHEKRKMKQDEGLDIISGGMDTLKDLAMDMSEELDKQVTLMDEIETKVDQATSDLRNNNVKLKDSILEKRPTKKIIIDIILMCVLLGIASYLYNIITYSF